MPRSTFGMPNRFPARRRVVRMDHPHSRLCLLLILAAFVATSLPAAMAATTITVNTLDDVAIPGDDACTLREAVGNANADSDLTSGDCAAGAGEDRVPFSVTGTIVLSSTLHVASGSLTLDGDQAIVLSGNDAVGVLAVGKGAELRLEQLTIERGLPPPAARSSASGLCGSRTPRSRGTVPWGPEAPSRRSAMRPPASPSRRSRRIGPAVPVGDSSRRAGAPGRRQHRGGQRGRGRRLWLLLRRPWPLGEHGCWEHRGRLGRRGVPAGRIIRDLGQQHPGQPRRAPWGRGLQRRRRGVRGVREHVLGEPGGRRRGRYVEGR